VARLKSILVSDPVMPITIPVTVISVVTIVITVPSMPTIPIVVESTNGVDHHIGDRRAGEHFHHTVSLMVGSGAQRHHQTGRNTCGSQPSGN
jgi:hypothetical protein